ncbi:MAG: hypothetical protein LBL94_11120, partial [Prevotellaceae bacterium]|jgi:hypothetical protein|nr:hypothetical protein [Prevotellaceae bacterium]
LIYNSYLAALNFLQNSLSGNAPFWFSRNAAASRKMDKLIADFNKNANALFLNGIERSWKLGEESLTDKMKLAFSGDARQRKAFDQIRTEATQQQRDQSSRASAERFADMKRNGLTLSNRVWNLGNGMKQELETIVQNGMKEGKTPKQLAKELKKYLNEPDKLFRRVKNKETGEMELSEAAKKYKPGQGVYRSASKNAMRLARTEIPAAYRRAQWEQIQTNPQVIGIRIALSNNHTCINPKTGKPEPFYDICDELAGNYPKSFLWTGWHPQCRCDMYPILTEDTNEIENIIQARIKGKTYTPKQITEMPRAFSDWLRINGDRIVRAQANNTLPYWLNDNLALLQKSGIIGKGGFTALAAKGLLSDPMMVNSFLSLVDFMRVKAAPQLRKIAFDMAMKNERYKRENDVFYMEGSTYSRAEKQTAEKLAKAGYYVVFPSGKHIKDIKIKESDTSARRNDVYIYDKKTYIQRKVDLKTVNGASPEAISSHIASGSGQAPVVAVDIRGKISKQDLIGAIRAGWAKNTREVLLNYKSQWYVIDKEKAFDKEYLSKTLK